MIRRLLLMSVTVAVTVAAILPGNAQATRKPTRTEVRGMTAAAVPPGGRIGWAQISTAGPYAVAWVVAARPRDPSFQDALLLLKGSGNRWGLTADIYHEGCPRVPRKVLRDLRRLLVKRKYIYVADHYGSTCAGRIARAR